MKIPVARVGNIDGAPNAQSDNSNVLASLFKSLQNRNKELMGNVAVLNNSFILLREQQTETSELLKKIIKCLTILGQRDEGLKEEFTRIMGEYKEEI